MKRWIMLVGICLFSTIGVASKISYNGLPEVLKKSNCIITAKVLNVEKKYTDTEIRMEYTLATIDIIYGHPLKDRKISCSYSQLIPVIKDETGKIVGRFSPPPLDASGDEFSVNKDEEWIFIFSDQQVDDQKLTGLLRVEPISEKRKVSDILLELHPDSKVFERVDISGKNGTIGDSPNEVTEVSVKNDIGITALSGETAMWEGYAEIVRLLLDAGADVNVSDENGDFPLTVAQRKGYTKIVNLLEGAGAQEGQERLQTETSNSLGDAPDTIPDDADPLYALACELYNSRDYNEAADAFGKAAESATSNNELKLWQANCFFLAGSRKKADEIYRALPDGINNREKAIMRFIINNPVHGAILFLNLNEYNPVTESGIEYLEDILDERNKYISTARPHPDASRSMLNMRSLHDFLRLCFSGARVEGYNLEGIYDYHNKKTESKDDKCRLNTYIGYCYLLVNEVDKAMSHFNNALNVGAQNLFENRMAEVGIEQLKMIKQAKEQYKIILVSMDAGDIKEIRKLVDTGVDVNVTYSRGGNTLLARASSEGYVEIAKLLLDAGADLNKVNYFDQTPLFQASREGETTIVKLLLDAGADVNKRDLIGNTPLSLASLGGHTEIVKLLQAAGVTRAQKKTISMSMNDKPERWEAFQAVRDATGEDYVRLRERLLTESDVAEKLHAREASKDWKTAMTARILLGWIDHAELYQKFLSDLDTVDIEHERRTVAGLSGVWDGFARVAKIKLKQSALPLAWEIVLKHSEDWPDWKVITALKILWVVPHKLSVNPILSLVNSNGAFSRMASRTLDHLQEVESDYKSFSINKP